MKSCGSRMETALRQAEAHLGPLAFKLCLPTETWYIISRLGHPRRALRHGALACSDPSTYDRPLPKERQLAEAVHARMSAVCDTRARRAHAGEKGQAAAADTVKARPAGVEPAPVLGRGAQVEEPGHVGGGHAGVDELVARGPAIQVRDAPAPRVCDHQLQPAPARADGAGRALSAARRHARGNAGKHSASRRLSDAMTR